MRYALLFFVLAIACASSLGEEFACSDKAFSDADLQRYSVDPNSVTMRLLKPTCELKKNTTAIVAECTDTTYLPGQTEKTCGVVVKTEMPNGIVYSAFKPGVVQCDMGMVLPMIPGETMWSDGFRTVLYFLALIYCFLGIAIVADKFMVAIEVITSQEKDITVFNNGIPEVVKVTVWNETIANLSLMALGSSAPEILLACVETIGELGLPPKDGLGASTIVGSAAFNLLAISAICVVAIPNGEVRRITDIGVFTVTAFFSVFAYVWLVIVLQVNSPGEVSLVEALITLAQFPLLLVVSYCQSKSWFRTEAQVTPTKSNVIAGGGRRGSVFNDNTKAAPTKDNITSLLKNVLKSNKQQNLKNADAADLAELATLQLYNQQPKSKLHYRINATRELAGGKRVIRSTNHETKLKDKVTRSTTKLLDEKPPRRSSVMDIYQADVKDCFVNFNSHEYTVFENEEHLDILVVRSGNLDDEVKVHFETSNGAAEAGLDYEYTAGNLVFLPGETHKTISIKIIDDNTYEPDEVFFCNLKNPSSNLKLGPFATTQITIINDDTPGVFSFGKENYQCRESDGQVEIQLNRSGGSDGEVTVVVKTYDGSAIAGKDYGALTHTLQFKHNETTKCFLIDIMDDERYECDLNFSIEMDIVDYPECGALYGPTRMAGIQIINDLDLANVMDQVTDIMKQNIDDLKITSETWSEQFKNAVNVSGEDGEDPSTVDYFMHFLTFGWKVIFAFIPPTSYGKGWVSFCVSLLFIAVLTVFVGDVANIFACLLGVPNSIAAITFVALGTSLPDTFASKTAAMNARDADASIGNITGSNSVNVFLGLGLPWTIAAIYHATTPGAGPFLVMAGTVSFSVIVFCCCAIPCIAILYIRRLPFCGGELGGPTVLKWLTSIVFFLLWCAYIALSALKGYNMI